MTEPRPLNEELPLAASMLSRLQPPAPLAADHEQRLWRAVLERRAGRRPSALRPLLAFSVAAAAASLLVMLGARVLAPVPSGDLGLVPLPGATLVQRPSQPPLLASGQVRGAPGAKAQRLATPHATAEWTAARFLLDVSAERSALAVEQGEVVWVPRDGAPQRLGAGARVRTPPAAPVELPRGFGEVTIAPSEECASDRACLERLAAGAGLAAQNALFELGRYREYLQRFPDGALAPEASLAELSALVRAHRYGEALAAARTHEAKFPGDAQVHALREQLEAHEAFTP